MADKLLRTALKGGEKASLQALDMIQNRVAGLLTRRVAAEVDTNCGVLVAPASLTAEEWIAAEMARNAMPEEPGKDCVG